MSDGGISYRDAMEMSETDRLSMLYAIVEAQGGIVDWATGDWEWPKFELD